jgi:hypothetical protein
MNIAVPCPMESWAGLDFAASLAAIHLLNIEGCRAGMIWRSTDC